MSLDPAIDDPHWSFKYLSLHARPQIDSTPRTLARACEVALARDPRQKTRPITVIKRALSFSEPA